MTEKPKNPLQYFLFALLLIGIDQASKLLVHHYMTPGFAGQIRLIGDWFKLYYVTNPGMAFGMQIEHEYGKLFLTVFRLGAMVFIAIYLYRLARRGAASGLLWAMAMILAGAIGNLIDSIFYGVWLQNAPFGSHTPWFHGQVIDMIFIDFWEGFIPDWVPVWGGQYYTTPIFNIADACIFVGVCLILAFQGTFFPHLHQHDDHDETDKESVLETNPLTAEPMMEITSAVDPSEESVTLEKPDESIAAIIENPDANLPPTSDEPAPKE